MHKLFLSLLAIGLIAAGCNSKTPQTNTLTPTTPTTANIPSPTDDIIIQDSGKWVSAIYPKDYHYSANINIPQGWSFDCCGDTDSFSIHNIFPNSTPDRHGDSGPLIRVIDFSLQACPNNTLSDCSIDAIKPVSARNFLKILAAHIDKTKEIAQFTNLSKASIPDGMRASGMYQGPYVGNQTTELYLLEGNKGVLGVAFIEQPGKYFAKEFKARFLNNITFRE